MQRFILLAIVWLSVFVMSAQDFEWARQMGDIHQDHGYSITTDSKGNVYTAGYFEGTVDFDPGAGVVNLTSNNSHDVFISKLDPLGNFLWAKRIGGTAGHDEATSITVDANDDIYITGYFQSTVDFDPGAGTFNLISLGDYDAFVCKLDELGSFIWAKQFGGTKNNRGYSIATDNNGNVYTTGYFNNSADFDPGAGTTNLTSNGQNDIFISKLNSLGEFVWAKQIGGADSDGGFSLSIDNNENVYITGSFYNTVDFDPGTGVYNLTSLGLSDIFICKLDASGNFTWANQIGGTGYDVGLSIKNDNVGNIYSTGYFSSTVDFDPSASVMNLTSAGDTDVYINKLDVSGNFIWAKQIGGSSTDRGLSISVDGNNNVYTTGYFYDINVDFDPGVSSFNLSSQWYDSFVSKLNSSGEFVWATKIGGTSRDYGRGITLYGNGIYTTGSYEGTVDFDSGTGVSSSTSNGIWDVFIHKLSQCIETSSTDIITACDSYTWLDGVEYFSDNSTATYVTTNKAGCDSTITLNLTINSTNSPIGNTPQGFCDMATINDLEISGTDVKWYSTSSSTTELGLTTSLLDGSKYYATQTLNSCESTSRLEVTVEIYNSPAPTITDLGGNLSTDNYLSYQWYLNGNAISGATSNIHTPTENGDYSVEVTDNNDCSGISTEYSVTGIVGVDENRISGLNIYPNPAQNELTISAQENISIELKDINGRIIYSPEHAAGEYRIDMGSFAEGVYILQVRNSTKTITRKVIKQ